MSRLTFKDKRTKNGIILPSYCNKYQEQVFTKLGQLENLEEELGIDLLTLFKTFKNGIFIKNNLSLNEFDYFKRPRVYYSDDYKCYCFELALGSYVIKLKDYGKTWALTREELK